MTDELIGKQVGGYEILDRLGQGGMATVFRARQTSMNRIVALKILPKHLMQDDTYLQRFEREVKIIAQLEHRNIVPVHDYGEQDGQPYIAMRYMPGGSVDDLIHAGPMQLDRVADIVRQIAPALDYAHSKNVLHRDLKPSNVLMDDDGGAYITDFGIARILGTETHASPITTQGIVGTPSYMSPEQAQGHKMDGRSDLYSLGIMLFEMTTGQRPFRNDTPYGIAVMQVTKEPPSPRSFNDSIPPAVEAVILRTLKKIPANRYQTAVELADALEEAINNPDANQETQPHEVPEDAASSEAMEMTQPAPSGAASRFREHPTVPSSGEGSAPVAPNAASNPAPASVNRTPPPPPSSPGLSSREMSSRVGRVKRRRPNALWLSIAIGGMFGCALLIGIVIVLGMVASSILNRDSSPANADGAPAGPIATLDPTSEAARQTMVGSAGLPGDELTTPLYTNATPIPSRTPVPESGGSDEQAPVGVRPTPTFPPDFPTGNSTIVYFAKEDDSYNIYRYDLITGERETLTRSDGDDSYPAISPDGERIAFQSNRDGDFDIYLMDIATREVVRFTDTEVDERIAAWSPDGEWVIYSSDTRGDGTFDLYRQPSTGGEPELVVRNGQRNSHARYSSDGRSLVFTSGDPDDASTWEIVLMDLSTGETIQLTNNAVRDASPSFSPDASRIIYNTAGEGRSSVVTASIDGSSPPTTLYDGPGYEWGMHYSPDGEFILFHEEDGDTSNIKMMRADGSDLRTFRNLDGLYPAWIP